MSHRRARRRPAPTSGAAWLAGLGVAVALLLTGDPGLALAGLVLGWLVAGPVGVGVLAARFGRDPAAWIVLSFVAPVLALVALLLCGPQQTRRSR